NPWCGETPYLQQFSRPAYPRERRAGPGNFSKTYSYTPANAGTYTLCAYLDDTTYDTPPSIGKSSVWVSSGASIAAVARPDGGTVVRPPVVVNFNVIGPGEASAVYVSRDPSLDRLISTYDPYNHNPKGSCRNKVKG
ncbi:MAG: hypothetical protein ACXVH3_38540, partial [Solirubrobacteraceae bacterium]